jgi:hypothetical protein
MSNKSEMHNNLSEEEINRFEDLIKSMAPRSLKNALSCYQIKESRQNYEAILEENEPCYIYCGDTGGGRNHMIYYKSIDQIVHILCFYIQEFSAHWVVDINWENHIDYSQNSPN